MYSSGCALLVVRRSDARAARSGALLPGEVCAERWYPYHAVFEQHINTPSGYMAVPYKGCTPLCLVSHSGHV